jgi:DNA polymerase III subunit delta'
MLFNRIKGHEHTISVLSDMCVNSSFSGPYLFKGPEAVGKYTIARMIAKYVTCVSEDLDPGCRCGSCRIFPKTPDYLDIDRGSSMIKVEDISPIEEYVSLAPFKSSQKIVVINNAENMNSAAANRFLKLLEVERAQVIFIFVTSNPDKMLSTVVSRCRILSFGGLDPENISAILSKVRISEKDIVFLRKIHNYVHGGILSDYNRYLELAKDVPSFVKRLSGKDEADLLIKISDYHDKGLLEHFLELLVLYMNDLLKVFYGSEEEVSFSKDIEFLEAASEKWEPDVCLTVIAKSRSCLEVHKSGLNLNMCSNVKSLISWTYMLLKRKGKDGK